jgi:hypothetical protein
VAAKSERRVASGHGCEEHAPAEECRLNSRANPSWCLSSQSAISPRTSLSAATLR